MLLCVEQYASGVNLKQSLEALVIEVTFVLIDILLLNALSTIERIIRSVQNI